MKSRVVVLGGVAGVILGKMLYNLTDGTSCHLAREGMFVVVNIQQPVFFSEYSQLFSILELYSARHTAILPTYSRFVTEEIRSSVTCFRVQL